MNKLVKLHIKVGKFALALLLMLSFSGGAWGAAHYICPAASAELVTNGDFASWSGDDPGNWFVPTEDAGNYVTESAGKARIVSDGASFYIAKPSILTVGKKYSYSFDVTAYGSGDLKNDSVTPEITFGITGTGKKTGTFTATSAHWSFTRVAACDITIDNVSIQEVQTGCDDIGVYRFFNSHGAMSAGDIVEMQAATAGGSVTFSETVAIYPVGNGTSGSHVTLRGRTGDAVTISSTANPALDIFYNYWDFSNFTITGNGDSGVFLLHGGTGISLTDITATSTKVGGASGVYANSNNLTGLSATRLRCINSTGRGFYATVAITGTITDSNFDGNYQGAYGTLGGITWTNCTFDRNTSDAFTSAGSNSGVLINCTANDNKDSQASPTAWYKGFTLNNSSSWVIKRCKSVNSSPSFVLLEGSDSNQLLFNIGDSGDVTEASWGVAHTSTTGASNDNNLWYNNTFIDRRSSSSFVFLYHGMDASTGGIKNNILWHTNGGYLIYLYAVSGGAYPVFDYNCVYTSASNSVKDQSTDRTWAAWKTASGGGDNSIFSDPLLSASYGIAGTSPSKNAGVPLWTYAAFPGDYYGNKIYGSKPDMGAIEKKQFIEDGDDLVFKRCKSSNTACYNAP